MEQRRNTDFITDPLFSESLTDLHVPETHKKDVVEAGSKGINVPLARSASNCETSPRKAIVGKEALKVVRSTSHCERSPRTAIVAPLSPHNDVRKQLTHLSEEDTPNSNIDKKIRSIFEEFIDPEPILDVFHIYDSNVLTKKDMEYVREQTESKGRSHGASVLFSSLVLYQNWRPCLLRTLRHPLVKQNHVAEMIQEVLSIDIQ